MDKPIQRMTTQEKVKNSEHLIRELAQHLEMGFLPRVKRLSRVTRLGQDHSKLQEIGDLTIRSHVAQVAESERFTESIISKLLEIIQALEDDMQKILYDPDNS